MYHVKTGETFHAGGVALMGDARFFSDREPDCRIDETARQALGHFLRERRERIAPADVGISSRRSRRTPGLRREEVAFLADIGVKWYARLEAGDEIHPSPATLTSIAVALRLSNVEHEYVLELAGLRRPIASDTEVTLSIPQSLAALVRTTRGIAVTVSDRILTPLAWNPLADELDGHSRFRLPVERNMLVRCLLDADFIEFLGPCREELVMRAIGMFRLNYASARPSPLLEAVYEAIKNDALFDKIWRRRTVSRDLNDENVTVRNHEVVGQLATHSTDLSIATSPDLLLRLVSPETEKKFVRLENLSSERSINPRSKLTACY